MSKRIYKERRLYFNHECEKCGNTFQSFKRARVKRGLCRNCRKFAPNPNQGQLFQFRAGSSIPFHSTPKVPKLRGAVRVQLLDDKDLQVIERGL